MNRATRAMGLLSFFSLVACKAHDGEPPPAPHSIRCVAATADTVKDELALRGSIAPRPDRESVVAAEIAGRVRSLSVREGDAVSVGSPIAEIECGPAEDAVRQAAAAAASASAAVTFATAAREREAHLVERGIAARQSLEAETAHEAAAKGSLVAAQAHLDEARIAVGRCHVRSSQNGIVIRVLRRQGDIVDGTSATAIAEIADPAFAEVLATAGASDLAKITAGQRVAVALVGASPAPPWTGVVVSAPPAVDRQSGLGAVRVSLDAGAHAVFGALVVATVDLGTSRSVVAVPKAAVRSAGGDASEVVVCAGATAKIQAVRVTGSVDGERLAVSGIAAGERVAEDGALGVEDGAAIVEAP